MTRKVGTTGRFGCRYGRKIRLRVREIETITKQRNLCPYCSFKRVRRVSTGIWLCTKCSAKFTGGAFAPQVESGAPKSAEKIVSVKEFEESQRIEKK